LPLLHDGDTIVLLDARDGLPYVVSGHDRADRWSKPPAPGNKLRVSRRAVQRSVGDPGAADRLEAHVVSLEDACRLSTARLHVVSQVGVSLGWGGA